MEHVKQVALERAIQFLNAAGVQYAILTPDGTKHGDLEIQQQTKPKCARKKSGIRYAVLWKPAFEKLQPGEVAVFTPPEGATLGATQSAISAAAHHTFGSGATITSQNTEKGVVEVLRIE